MDSRYRDALAGLTQSALAGAELIAFLDQLASLLAEALGASCVEIWEASPDGDRMVLRAGVGWKEALVGGSGAGWEESLAEPPRHTREGRPPRLRAGAPPASLSAVIPGRERPYGILVAEGATRLQFDGKDLIFLQACAALLALAVERDRMREMLEQRVEERTRLIEERLVAAAQEKAVLEERQRLARDLHDSVTQALYGVTLHAEAARRLLTSGAVTTAVDYLREIHDTAQEALDEMRLLIFELRSPILEQTGLVSALQARLDAAEGRANLKTTLTVCGSCDLPPIVEKALYRIAQEALNNALKHAHARRISVLLEQAHDRATLEIVDDGVGFDPSSARETGGLGLRGIAERVAQLAGRVSIQSEAGAGTRLRVEITL